MKQINLGKKLLYYTTKNGQFHWVLEHNYTLYVHNRKNIPYIAYSGNAKEIEEMVQAYILKQKKNTLIGGVA